jgi:hypothetical protein
MFKSSQFCNPELIETLRQISSLPPDSPLIGDLNPILRCGRIADEGRSHLGLRTHQQIKGHGVRDHQYGHVDDRDRVCDVQLPCQRGKVDLDGVVIVKDEVDRPNQIESDDEQPEQRTNPYGERRQGGQHAGGKVPLGGERGEACRQIGADDAWKKKDEPEEAEAM